MEVCRAFEIFEIICLVIFIIVCIGVVLVGILLAAWEIKDNTWTDTRKSIKKRWWKYLLVGVIEVIVFAAIGFAYLYIKSMFC